MGKATSQKNKKPDSKNTANRRNQNITAEAKLNAAIKNEDDGWS